MDRSEAAPLSFGQLAAWRDHWSMPTASRKDLNSLHVVPAPPGTSRAAALAALRTLERVHVGMATVLRAGADGPVQRPVGSAPPEPAVVAVPPDTPAVDLRALVETAVLDDLERPFDLGTERPYRPHLVGADEVRGLSLVTSHVLADHWAADVLKDDLHTLLAGGAVTGGALTPVALAAQQRSGRGRQRDGATREYWDEISAGVAATGALGRHEDRDPAAAVRGILRSAEAGRALPRAAHGLGVSAAAVLVTCCARAVAEELSGDDALLHVMASNRYLPGVARLVTPLSQWTPLLLRDLRTGPLPDLVRRIRWDLLSGLRHGSYDSDAYADARGIGREAGEGAWDGFFVNILPGGAPAPGPDQDPEVTLEPAQVRTGPVFYLQIREGIPLTVGCRTMLRSVGAERVDRLLRRIRDLVLDLAPSRVGEP